MSPLRESATAAEATAELSPGALVPPPEPGSRTPTYQRAAVSETLEDYSLRYAPVSFHRWTAFVVATTAIGGIAYLAHRASIVLTNGAKSWIAAILVAAVIIFVTGIPIARACAKYGVDMDPLTRGAGLGYLGSTLTSLIYASFTFIFFALEGSIMAQGLQYAFGMPLPVGYLVSSLLIVPIVVFGMKALSKLHIWTQPIWLVLLALPFVMLAIIRPMAFQELGALAGINGTLDTFSWHAFGLGMGVALSLIAQIGEQARLPAVHAAQDRRELSRVEHRDDGGRPGMGRPRCRQANRRRPPRSLGPGLGASAAEATEPIRQYADAIKPWLGGATVAVATIFVVMSQIKINTTNAYSGSLSWSNFFSRLTHRHPGRVYYVALNVGVATVLMELNMFSFPNAILSFSSNVGVAWIGAVCADLLINKPMGWSPKYIEFKRAYLYTINPVGFGAMTIASVVSVAAFFKLFGDGWPYAFSPLIALVIAMTVSPLLALATKGKYYPARPNLVYGAEAGDVEATERLSCATCRMAYERPDMADCSYSAALVCSLCCVLEKRCHDECKRDGGVSLAPVLLGTPTVGAPA